jgi:hypothetical protein
MTTLFENLESGDLKRLVDLHIQIDEYQSKMGDDSEISVIHVTTNNGDAGKDIVNFAEMGYSWLLDADVSTGENNTGKYLVFLEIARNETLVDNIIKFVEDMCLLTNSKFEEWTVGYKSSSNKFKLTKETLQALVPTAVDDYNARYDKADINKLKHSAGIPTHNPAPVNEHTTRIKLFAGITK